MKKMKLDLDDLKVESFATTPEPSQGRGTVFGVEDTWPPGGCTAADCTAQTSCHPDYCYTRGGDGCPFTAGCGTGEATCHNTGCFGGLTSMCGTAGATECPGETGCGGFSQAGGQTCGGSCTDFACTYCGYVC